MATITGSEVLAKALRTQGIDTMFYVMGGPMLETEAACIQLGIKAIDTRHEQAASLSAHAWTRVMQRPAVAMGCSGPGATNLLTGVANAFTDCAPMVAIGGSSPRVFLGMEAFQEIDQVAVFKPVTKFAQRIYDAKRIPDVVATAIREATSGRPGPVYLDLPGDILGEKIEEDAVTYPAPWKPSPRTLGDPNAVREAIALLARAERPVIVAGSGVWWSDGARELQSFVEATGIPFYTTPISRGLIPEDHALAFLNARSKAFTEADVVLALGTRFNWVIQFGRPPRFAADLKVIHVDINPTQLGHNRNADVPIAGDARAVLEQVQAEGVGLPFGVGAKVAKPDAQVVVLHGDGSFGINAMDIDTAVRHNIPVIVVISNNGGWTANAPWTRPLPKPGRNLGHTRYDKVAQDLGAHGEFVEKPHEIRPALERAYASGRPAVVNVITDSKARAQTVRFSAYTT